MLLNSSPIFSYFLLCLMPIITAYPRPFGIPRYSPGHLTRHAAGPRMRYNRGMNIFHRTRITPGYIARNLSVVVGIVLIWRGIWYALDAIDVFLFGGSHSWTAIGGIVLGLVVLYIPDKDLKELGKL